MLRKVLTTSMFTVSIGNQIGESFDLNWNQLFTSVGELSVLKGSICASGYEQRGSKNVSLSNANSRENLMFRKPKGRFLHKVRPRMFIASSAGVVSTPPVARWKPLGSGGISFSSFFSRSSSTSSRAAAFTLVFPVVSARRSSRFRGLRIFATLSESDDGSSSSSSSSSVFQTLIYAFISDVFVFSPSPFIFSGMSMQLIGLQNQTSDFSKAGLSQIDANCTTLGVQKSREHAVKINVAEETSLEGCSEDVAISDDCEVLSAGIPVQVEGQNSEEHASVEGEAVLVTIEGEAQTTYMDSSKDGQLEEINTMEIDRVDDGISDVVGHAATPGAKLAVPSGPPSGDNINMLACSLKLSTVDNGCGAEVILQNDEEHSPKNRKLGLQPDEKGALIMGGNAVNDVHALHIVEVNGKSSISPKAVPAAKDESALVETEGGMLSEFPQDCQIGGVENTSSAMAATELDNSSVDSRAYVQSIGGNNGLLDENEMSSEQARDEDGVTISIEGAVLEPNVDMENVSFHGGEDSGCVGANQKNTTDAEICMLHSFAARASDVFEDVIDENDTEFLNVDDDEVAEEEDNNMPSAEEFLENSGWSSRTRAVARYLQTLFDDAGHEREVVRMDHLLAGKTRKESARMFFETLVLKTRDYIHVEQESSFVNINIKPRGKLMKANF
ncbi:sister chromatid cohesion 1 protein 4-like [Macadamia integrifolia]|uniref:sister chromatid cohesion 1 protein 4-like n=1 Tax=Macadamia integrifolia TaxID=60698 RepID=UPI001C4F1D9B|nr:sister chromatid cohesion 1 protein 4-like [Macadamia integrifolia]